MDLTGKVAIVTGSGRGLGLAYAAGVTGQAVGIGGDRLGLWSHPSEVVVGFADGGGWSPVAIVGVRAERFAPAQQLPEPPQ